MVGKGLAGVNHEIDGHLDQSLTVALQGRQVFVVGDLKIVGRLLDHAGDQAYCLLHHLVKVDSFSELSGFLAGEILEVADNAFDPLHPFNRKLQELRHPLPQLQIGHRPDIEAAVFSMVVVKDWLDRLPESIEDLDIQHYR